MRYRVVIYVDGNANYEDEIYTSRKHAEQAAEETVQTMKWDPAWENSDITYRIDEC